MKASSIWNFRSILGKIILGFVLVTMIGSIDVVPAIGRDDHERRDRDDRRYEHNRRGHDRDRDRRDHDRDRRVYDHSNYRGRGYAPPPVVYLPPPPPGLGIFFPPIHH
jgi:hypothetical protein